MFVYWIVTGSAFDLAEADETWTPTVPVAVPSRTLSWVLLTYVGVYAVFPTATVSQAGLKPVPYTIM